MKTWYILAICAVLVGSVLAVQPASGVYNYEGTVVTIGDSNTRPNNMQPEEMWPGLLTGLFGTQVINKGIPAQPASSMLDRFEKDVEDNDAAMVVIMGGTNDIGREIHQEDVNVATIEKNLREMYDTALDDGMVVIACTILPNDTFMPWQQAYVRQVNDWIRAQASDRIIIADANAALRDPSSPDNFNPAYVIDDGVHLNKAGHQVMANLVYSVAPTSLAENHVDKGLDLDADNLLANLTPGGSLFPVLFGGVGLALVGYLAVEVRRNNGRKRK